VIKKQQSRNGGSGTQV